MTEINNLSDLERELAKKLANEKVLKQNSGELVHEVRKKIIIEDERGNKKQLLREQLYERN
jgi:hypothetical protein